MSVILQVNYIWDVEEDVANRVADNAERYNDIPGLQWKLWIRDAETKTSAVPTSRGPASTARIRQAM